MKSFCQAGHSAIKAAALPILFVLPAIGTVSSGAAAAEASYSCSDGTRLKAVFSPPEQQPGRVILTISGREITLPQSMSADGGRYIGDGIEFWIKGDDATFTRNGASTTCHTR